MNRDLRQVFWLTCSLLVLLFSVTVPLVAQQEDRPLSLHVDEEAMRTVLDRIEAQTGLSFSYSSRLVDERKG